MFSKNNWKWHGKCRNSFKRSSWSRFGNPNDPFQRFFYLSVSPARRASPFSPSLSSIVFTPPSVPPVLGDRNPKGREDVTALQCYICPTCPSPAGGSLTHSQALALSKRARDVTAPSRCSEPLRSMDGGPSKVFAMLCGMGPPGDNLLMGPPGGKVYNLQFIINSLLFRVNSL